MKHYLRIALLALGAALVTLCSSQVPVVAAADHRPWLASPDPRLAANKQLVYDFWRTVIDAGRLESAGDFLAPDYIQHNPNVPTGRQGFVDHFRSRATRRPVGDRIRAPLVSIVAEGDLVVMSFVAERADPLDRTARYTTTWFDMFRIEQGRIAEHWDSALK